MSLPRKVGLARKQSLRRSKPPLRTFVKNGVRFFINNDEEPKRKPIRRVRPATNWKKALDKLCREVVFARDGYKCVRCNKVSGLQWCHVHSRRYLSTRWLLENSMTLCAGHHLAWHHRPLEAAEWFRNTYPGRAERLRLRSSSKQKVDHKLIRLALEAEARALGVDL